MCGSRSPLALGCGYTASGSSDIITDAGVLSVNGAATVFGASTCTCTVTIRTASIWTGTVKIVVRYTYYAGATITDAGVLSANGSAMLDGVQP